MKNEYYVFLIFLIFLNCKDFMENATLESTVERTVKLIESEYRGVVIDKYSPREFMSPTHLRILTRMNDTISVYPNEQIVKAVNIGDSIIKIKNENSVNIKFNNGKNVSYFYIRISQEERNYEAFPDDWRGKWMESTKRNDSLN